MKTKQVILIRSDLKLRRGKECAQVAHAASMWLMMLMKLQLKHGGEISFTSEELDWINGNYRKIVLNCKSEKTLLSVLEKSTEKKLTVYTVHDNGLTEIPPGTVTALAIGPHEESKFEGLTDSNLFSLY